MRTPGHDFDLAAGFLVSEGVISTGDEFSAARYCAGATAEGLNTYNVLDVTLAPGVPAPDPSLERAFYTTSSCGLCGKASIDAVRTKSQHAVLHDPRHRARSARDVPRPAARRPGRLREDRRAARRRPLRRHHRRAAGAARGRRPAQRRRQGRRLGREGGTAPLAGTVLMVSGRASFELTQKASMAGIPMMAAVSAPSSLAVDLANELGVTIVGFLRGSSMVVYSRPDRLGEPDGTQPAAGAGDPGDATRASSESAPALSSPAGATRASSPVPLTIGLRP
nr:formate dehydrogenase accessory sulfurtransferase FdhD [Microbacterium flavescens]